MNDRRDEDETQDAHIVRSRVAGLGRRDLMKLGAGVVATALTAPKTAAQESGGKDSAPPAPGSARKPGEPRIHTGPGYRNTANRLGNNGPMDDTTRKIVKFVSEFNESKLTEAVVHAINRTMIDSMASIVAGFEEEPVRVAARVARQVQPVGLKSTVFGYGISTTPELAAFANGVQVRVVDFNDNPHTSNLIPGALAVGEALHSTGAQVMTAITIGYEVQGVGAGESVAPAMAAGKLMGLDEDRLANALTIALTPHVALNKGVGALSMWKGVRSAEATKCGIWAAVLAREGMTGPPQPFEGRGGLWSVRGRRDFTLPREELLAIQRNWFKWIPTGASMNTPILLVPEMRAWTTVEEIDWIHCDMDEIGENSDNPKWDPRNRETADHSMPYILARALIDGEDIYMDSFRDEKLPYRDPVVRALMDRMTFAQVKGWRGSGIARITIGKKNGEERTFDTHGGKRVVEWTDFRQLTDEELAAKFNRACTYMKMNDAQRDRARAIWGNLRQVKDIGEAIQTLAKFGQPKPFET